MAIGIAALAKTLAEIGFAVLAGSNALAVRVPISLLVAMVVRSETFVIVASAPRW